MPRARSCFVVSVTFVAQRASVVTRNPEMMSVMLKVLAERFVVTPSALRLSFHQSGSLVVNIAASTPSTKNAGVRVVPRAPAPGGPAPGDPAANTWSLLSAAAVNLGLDKPDSEHKDLDEARKLITALAGLVTASATEVSSFHAAPLRDGLKSLQLAFREASIVPDEPGQGPGEKFTGPVFA